MRPLVDGGFFRNKKTKYIPPTDAWVAGSKGGII